MDNKNKTILGFSGAMATSVIWGMIPGHEQFALNLKRMTSATGEPEKSPLAFIEHYHYGLSALILGKLNKKYSPYLYGFGTGMIGSELLGDQPFGIGKTPDEVSGNVFMLMILGGLFVAASLPEK